MEPLRLTVWQVIAAALLKRHFGLSLNDTALCETDTVTELIANGVRPSDAINELVDKYDLTRMNASAMTHSTPYLGVHDELMVIFDSQVTDIFRRDFN
ncbi:TA system toxin CbtA family protein [Xenorhabdus sp. XENO-10]|uniref:TA system toxin CbtA family protein n=1 Tax=Xenorhabdus yunnanensis TaxID=3025878 RepID=A0ABT5LKP0_9GAMM|nr:TA system toxin CbtA family protein [Xenorhabdus yunnanensis]MDC9591681.1 TA system toxin CbtA family protein [Xenorhabdus yunnanensis]